MTTKLYWICVAMFLIGQVLTLMLMTIPKHRKMAKAANKHFSLKAWFNSDWNLVVATQAMGVALILGLDQLLSWKPEILNYVKWFFLAVGGFSETIGSKWSSFGKNIEKLLDIKANVADNMVGHSATVEEVKEKFTETTGESSKQIEKHTP